MCRNYQRFHPPTQSKEQSIADVKMTCLKHFAPFPLVPYAFALIGGYFLDDLQIECNAFKHYETFRNVNDSLKDTRFEPFLYYSSVCGSSDILYSYYTKGI